MIPLDGAVIAVAVILLVCVTFTTLAHRLQERRVLLDGLFEQVPQAIAVTNADSRVVREFTRVFGYTPQETSGRLRSELIVPMELRAKSQDFSEPAWLGQRVDVVYRSKSVSSAGERVSVHVWAEAGNLNVRVEDRGCGFDPEVTLKEPRSSGFFGMLERVALLGGRMTIESSPGAGTAIIAELPLGKTPTTCSFNGGNCVHLDCLGR